MRLLRSLVPLPAVGLAVALAGAPRATQAADPAPRGRVAAAPDVASRVASSVDSSRIRETIRLLSQDSTGAPVSRYAERSATRLLYAPLVRALLDSAGVDTSFFFPFTSVRTDTPQVNVVGIRRAAIQPSAGLVLLTAHLDATGRRTEGGWEPL